MGYEVTYFERNALKPWGSSSLEEDRTEEAFLFCGRTMAATESGKSQRVVSELSDRGHEKSASKVIPRIMET